MTYNVLMGTLNPTHSLAEHVVSILEEYNRDTFLVVVSCTRCLGDVIIASMQSAISFYQHLCLSLGLSVTF